MGYVLDDCGCPAGRGHHHPRIFTPPLRELTPETTDGFKVIELAKLLGLTLMPWQRWFLIHALEKNLDGTFRFRTILLLVARQNGKTTVVTLLILFWLVLQKRRLVVTTAQKLSLAEETWDSVIETIENHIELQGLLRGEPSRAFGKKKATLTDGQICEPAVRSKGGTRGKTIHNFTADELREDTTWEGWAALSKATMAVWDAIGLVMSNAGDLSSVVLAHLRSTAILDIEEGRQDGTIGLFDWSADEKADPGDVEAQRQANPAYGYTITPIAIQDSYDNDPLPVYRTEVLCQWVDRIDAAIDVTGWDAGSDPRGSVKEAFKQKRLHAAIEANADGTRVSLVVGARDAHSERKRTRVQLIKSWVGPDAIDQAEAEAPTLIRTLRPLTLSWYPTGPGAVLRGCVEAVKSAKLVQVTGASVSEVCMSLSRQVTAGNVVHSGEPLFHTQAVDARRVNTGDGWKLERREESVEALYAVAAVVQQVRIQPEPSFQGTFPAAT